MSPTAPKVFLSHASEDKSRFVIAFATALRAKGVDVWVDRWEILPGDSLVQKIFEEGLKEAAAVVVVLSRFSVDTPWVKEELDNAVVKRINTGSKLIPVVLDDCPVPQVLMATAWEKVPDLGNIDTVVDRVAAAIFDHRHKPPLGPAPVYASTQYFLPGLSPTDAYVLVESARWLIDHEEAVIDPAKLFLEPNSGGLSKESLIDSIDMLEQTWNVKVLRVFGPGPHSYRLTDAGMELYLSNYFPQYDEKIRGVIALVVNRDMHTSDSLAAELNVPRKVVHHILSRLENDGHLKLSRSLGRDVQIFHTSASLKRLLDT